MSWLSRCVPPIVADLLSRRSQPFIWEGVYPRLSDVPTERAAYAGELVDEMVYSVGGALRQLRSGKKPFLWHESFAMVAGSAALPAQRLNVIDFGGGVGSAFVQLQASLPATVALDYLVVDNDDICRAGSRLFEGDARIRFTTELPATPSAIDIVYVNSVLQYIDDYRGMLGRLAALDARYVLLARLAAGPQPTFASRQLNIPGRVLPYWFLNIGEVTSAMADAGYDLACDAFLERIYDHGNLPETHRVPRFRDVLFARRHRP